MKFCPQCGAGFEPEARFCQECGFDKQSLGTESSGDISAASETVNTNLPEANCPKCASPLAAEDRFCANCGFDKQAVPAVKPVPEPEPVPLPACPKCNAPLADADRFCAECGFDKQAAVAEVVPPVVIPEVVPEPEPVSAPAVVLGTCPKCNAPLADADRFCAECGFDKQAAVAEVVPPVVIPEVVPEPEPEPVHEVIPEPAPVAEVVPEPVVENNQPQTAFQFCPNCGSKQSSEDVFCQDCGQNMNDEVPAATVAEPVTYASPVPAPAPPVAEQKPVKKEKVISKPVSEPKPAAPVAENKKKSSKLVLIILLGVLGLGALGAGGWFAYNKFIAKDTTEVAVATPEAEQEVATPAEQPEEVIPEQEPPAETPAEEPVKPAEPAKKTEKTKKTTPKKQTEPQKQQVVQEETVKKDEGVKVVMKNTTSAKSPVTLFSSFNTNEVKSGPVFAQKVKFDKPTIVTRITTFHHNDGQGAVAGTISLEGKKKESGGPWQARNAYGSDGTVNGKWICEPNARMEPGTYKVVVSDEKSWSYNTQSGRKGFVIIEGYETD